MDFSAQAGRGCEPEEEAGRGGVEIHGGAGSCGEFQCPGDAGGESGDESSGADCEWGAEAGFSEVFEEVRAAGESLSLKFEGFGSGGLRGLGSG